MEKYDLLYVIKFNIMCHVLSALGDLQELLPIRITDLVSSILQASEISVNLL